MLLECQLVNDEEESGNCLIWPRDVAIQLSNKESNKGLEKEILPSSQALKEELLTGCDADRSARTMFPNAVKGVPP